jgi:hypothetical protein
VYGVGQPHLEDVTDRVLRFMPSAPPIASLLGQSRLLFIEIVAWATYRAAMDLGEWLLDVSYIRDLAE